MLPRGLSAVETIEFQAESELASFLAAAAEKLGEDQVLRAGNAWIDAMSSLVWPKDNHDRFFRHVTAITISRLLRSTSESIAMRLPVSVPEVTHFHNHGL
jgi:hypothetical protein